MTDTPIKAVFTYTRDEYLRAIRRHYKTNIHAYRDIAAGVFALIAGVIAYLSFGSRFYVWMLIIAGLILLLLVAYAFLILPRLIHRFDPKLKWEYSLVFYDDRIEFRTNDIDSTLQWPLYHSWLRDDEFYILYHGKRHLSVIPRRVLASGGSDEQFAELLQRKIGPPLHVLHFRKKE